MPTWSTSPGEAGFGGCCSVRLLQLFSTCVAFSLVADMGFLRGAIGNWAMSFWCVCFALTFIIAVVECCRRWSSFPFFWYNISVTYACYAALICLSASIIYSITYVLFVPYGPYRDRAIAATAFSCIASVQYVIEVAGMRHWYDLQIFCVHTMRALLVYVANLGYWACQVSVGTEDVSSAPDSVQAYPVSSKSEGIL